MTAMDLADLEKGIEEAVATPDAQIPAMAVAGGEEKDLLIPDLPALPQEVIDGGVIGANMMNNPHKKWLRWWLAVTASVIFLTNHIHAASKYQLTLLEPMVIFTMFTCAIFLVFGSMKEMM